MTTLDDYDRFKKSNSTFLVVVIIAIAVIIIIVLGNRNGSLNINEPPTSSAQLARSESTAQKPIASTPPSVVDKKAQAARAAKEALEAEKTQEQIRVGYAKLMENNFLRNGFNVDVIAGGPKHTHLTMKWILASKSLAFQFTEQQQDTLRQMKQEGFKRFTITDGYEQSWTWKLDD